MGGSVIREATEQISAWKIAHQPEGHAFFEVDFEGAAVIERRMRLRLLRCLITYAMLILYVLIPMLDSMVCADCIGKAPFQGETTIGHLETAHDDVSYSSQAGTQSKTPGEQNSKFVCSICANVLMGVEVFLPQVPISIAKWHDSFVLPALSELHYSVNKPPQNLLA